jgi:hypothetical protein
MSQFEYVSVAVALVFTLVVGRGLAGVNQTVASERRYLVHAGWLAHILLACVAQWWALWRANTVEWTAFRFLWVLGMPSIQYLRAAVLLGDAGSVSSYRDHFYRVRRPFFALGFAVAIHAALTPWVLGLVPWLVPAPIHTAASVIAVIAVVGFVSSNERVHAIILWIAIGLVVASFALPPVPAAV